MKNKAGKLSAWRTRIRRGPFGECSGYPTGWAATGAFSSRRGPGEGIFSHLPTGGGLSEGADAHRATKSEGTKLARCFRMRIAYPARVHPVRVKRSRSVTRRQSHSFAVRARRSLAPKEKGMKPAIGKASLSLDFVHFWKRSRRLRRLTCRQPLSVSVVAE
jgi:hypothetical protein